MWKHKNTIDKKYRCWVNEQNKILSFSYKEGYEMIEFDKREDFQQYYYQKTYWGYRVQ